MKLLWSIMLIAALTVQTAAQDIKWEAFIDQMLDLSDDGVVFKDVAVDAKNNWIIIYGRNSASYNFIPPNMEKTLKKLQNENKDIKQVELLGNGGWLIRWGNNGFAGEKLPPKMAKQLIRLNKTNKKIISTSVALPSWSIIYSPGKITYEYLGTKEVEILSKLMAEGKNIRCISSVADRWIILFNDKGFVSNNLGQTLNSNLTNLVEEGYHVNFVKLFPNGKWIIVYGDNQFILPE